MMPMMKGRADNVVATLGSVASCGSLLLAKPSVATLPVSTRHHVGVDGMLSIGSVRPTVTVHRAAPLTEKGDGAPPKAPLRLRVRKLLQAPLLQFPRALCTTHSLAARDRASKLLLQPRRQWGAALVASHPQLQTTRPDPLLLTTLLPLAGASRLTGTSWSSRPPEMAGMHLCLTTKPTTKDDRLHGSMLNSFGEMGISYPTNIQLLHQPSAEPSAAALPGHPSAYLTPAVDQAGNEWVTNRNIAEAISWDHLGVADSAQRTFFSNCGTNAHTPNSWDAFVARTPAIDFSGMQGPSPHMHSEICFAPGVQIAQSGSDKDQMDNVTTGREIVTAIISRVASLPSEKQHWFIRRVADLLSPSLLGAPMLPDSEPGKIKKKLFASMTKMSKKTKAHTASHSFMASRKSQARFCVRLGLIKDISEFNEETLKMYLSFFKNPMPEPYQLAKVAGINAPPCINLPDDDLQLILDELNAETN
ncbi:hypothetical protein ZWY2020_052362 [Hordeum vulgare]|nr:hypothetical protein ZWY2020_052362 [Hordeum vulgare]